MKLHWELGRITTSSSLEHVAEPLRYISPEGPSIRGVVAVQNKGTWTLSPQSAVMRDSYNLRTS